MIRLAVILMLSACAARADLHMPRMLEALRQVEDFGGVDGKAGERGPWQLMPITWRQHMHGVSFALARDEATARVCAERHLRWLQRSLRAARREPTPYMLALAWNAGLSRTLAGRAPRSSHDYAERATNLYDKK